jgi:hypothetical protein
VGEWEGRSQFACPLSSASCSHAPYFIVLKFNYSPQKEKSQRKDVEKRSPQNTRKALKIGLYLNKMRS